MEEGAERVEQWRAAKIDNRFLPSALAVWCGPPCNMAVAAALVVLEGPGPPARKEGTSQHAGAAAAPDAPVRQASRRRVLKGTRSPVGDASSERSSSVPPALSSEHLGNNPL